MVNYRSAYFNELYHYGVPGTKWGVRNGPPYPLYRQTAAWKSQHPSRGGQYRDKRISSIKGSKKS